MDCVLLGACFLGLAVAFVVWAWVHSRIVSLESVVASIRRTIPVVTVCAACGLALGCSIFAMRHGVGGLRTWASVAVPLLAYGVAIVLSLAVFHAELHLVLVRLYRRHTSIADPDLARAVRRAVNRWAWFHRALVAFTPRVPPRFLDDICP